MNKTELKKKIAKVIDKISDPCDICADEDFKPKECKHFHENWEKEGLETFCDMKDPFDELMDIIEQYKAGKK